MRLTVLVSVIAGLFWVIPQPVFADPVVLFFSRTATAGVQLGGTFVEDVERNADVLFATASTTEGQNSASAAAILTSFLSADNQSLSGVGLTTGSSTTVTGAAVGFGSSQALLEFSIDQPYTYAFFSSFARGVEGFSVFEASLLDRSSPGFLPVFDYREESATVRSDTGLLLPGRYQFFVLGRTSAGCGFAGNPCTVQGLTSFSFDFSLTPESDTPAVPEPGTLILLGSGVAGLVASRRRAGSSEPSR